MNVEFTFDPLKLQVLLSDICQLVSATVAKKIECSDSNSKLACISDRANDIGGRVIFQLFTNIYQSLPPSSFFSFSLFFQNFCICLDDVALKKRK